MNEETKSVLKALKQNYEFIKSVYEKRANSKSASASNYEIRLTVVENVIKDINDLLAGRPLKDYYGTLVDLKGKSVKPKTTKVVKRK